MLRDLQVTWKGRDYAIPARKQLEAIGRIEEFLTRKALMALIFSDDPPLQKLAQAWTAVLRLANAPAKAEQAYAWLCAPAPDGDDFWTIPHVAVASELLQIMLLPQQFADFHAMVEAALGQIRAGGEPEAPEAAGPLAESATAVTSE